MEQKALEEMVLEQKKRISEIEKSAKSKSNTPSVDVERVEKLIASVEQISNAMEQVASSNAKQSAVLKQTIEEARKPVVNRNIHEINFNSSQTFYLILASIFAVIFLGLTTFKALQPNMAEQDNDLKYRCIKMKGEATPAMIAELEEFFGEDRNPKAVKALRKNIETFEEAVRKQAHADEQARLNRLESERQKDKAKSVQNK